MKLMHLSDLHLGKRVNGFSMTGDQDYILREILNIIDDEKPDAVLISGDVYDKSIPPVEAVELFDFFLRELAARHSSWGMETFIISGNHDSPERLSFASSLIDLSGIHISPVYDGRVKMFTLQDEYGPVNFWLLPFVRPANVRAALDEAAEAAGTTDKAGDSAEEDEGTDTNAKMDADNGCTDSTGRQETDDKSSDDSDGSDDNRFRIRTYTDAIRAAVNAMHIDTSERNVLLSHQFVTGASRSESEEVSVGGLDNVDASVYAPFDYVALGHIHSPQNINTCHIRYCGTPLKYSFSEANQTKSVTIVELNRKVTPSGTLGTDPTVPLGAEKSPSLAAHNGQTGTMGTDPIVPPGTVPSAVPLTVRTVPLVPRHDMREIRGTYDELMDRRNYEGTRTDDYLHITLTDENDVVNAVERLRTVYPNLMKLDFDNTRTRTNQVIEAAEDVKEKSPCELIGEFYEKQNNRPLDEDEAKYVKELIENIWG